MRLVLMDGQCLGGIYTITNRVDGRVYVGQSMDIRRRHWYHCNLLKKVRHTNAHLQHAVVKYGFDSFIMEQVEAVYDIASLDAAEQWWLDIYRDHRYNILPTAGSNRGWKMPPESGIKKSLATRGKPHSAEHNARVKEAHTGTRRTEEARARIGAVKRGNTHGARAWNVEVLSPACERVAIESNISAFCRERGLTQSNFMAMVHGKIRHSQGWRLVGDPLPYKKRKLVAVALCSPDGEVHRIDSLARFCRERGLPRQTIRKLLMGERKHVEGWTVAA